MITMLSTRTVAASVFLAFLGFASSAFSQDMWTAKASIPTPLFGASTGVINGQLYVAGGCCVTFSYPFTRFNTLQVYDPTTDTWTTKAPMPVAVYGAATGVINGKLYVAGGQADAINGNNIATLQIYDPATDTWTTGRSLPEARSAANAGVIGGKLYVAGGTNPSNTGEVDTVVVYDPVANTWSNLGDLAPMPNPREFAGTAVINGILYVVGGYTSGQVATNIVDSYNPITNTWSPPVKSMPTARYALVAGAIDGILYAAGGTDNINTFKIVESYDPVANSWVSDPSNLPSMLAAAYLPAAGVITDTFYVAGGATLPQQLVNSVQAFTPNNCMSSPCIKSPRDGASPTSYFAALSGRGVPGDSLAVIVNGVSVGSVTVASDGLWEALPDLSLYGSTVQIEVVDQTTSIASNIITVYPQTAGLSRGPVTPSRSRLLPLRHGDIFVGSDPNSPQLLLYGPTYTHTALYLGGDSNGTPMVAEAVTPWETGPDGQQVRSVSLEQSLLWTENRITGWSPKKAISSGTRDEIVAWASTVTNRGLSYFPFQALIEAVKAVWTPKNLTSPSLVDALNNLNSAKTSNISFICSSLVWAAYWHGSAQTLDISDPNNMTASSGLLHFIPDIALQLFIDVLRPVVVIPETFARSPKLKQIF